MRQRFFVCVVLAGMLMDLSGCASVQKKFTRKKKEPKHVAAAIYLEDVAYVKKFSNSYYYKTHYMFWRSWHSDMINELGGNRKRLARSAQEAYSHLEQLAQYLTPEKQTELKPHLEALAQLREKIERGSYSESETGGMRTELEKIRRLVSNDFYYEKVKAFILPDKVDLGSE
jgi:hypothetical protein